MPALKTSCRSKPTNSRSPQRLQNVSRSWRQCRLQILMCTLFQLNSWPPRPSRMQLGAHPMLLLYRPCRVAVIPLYPISRSRRLKLLSSHTPLSSNTTVRACIRVTQGSFTDGITVHMFYSMFLTQMPIMHLGTFTVDGKPDILISAMQACGALYVKTQAATSFIDSTLASARDQLVCEFVSATITLTPYCAVIHHDLDRRNIPLDRRTKSISFWLSSCCKLSACSTKSPDNARIPVCTMGCL